MCPDIANLTCYVGDYNQLLGVFVAALSAGMIIGALVGLIVYVIKSRS